jgi:hypothetical protein
MDSNKLLNTNELADLLGQLDTSGFEDEEMSQEMQASQRRYEEILKKHENNNT